MEIQKMDKVIKIYEKVRVLDVEIIEPEKQAMILCNDETDVSIDFKVVNNTTKKDEGIKLDADGSLPSTESIFSSMMRSYTFCSTTPETKENKNVKTFNHNVSITNALKILHILLGDKLQKRIKLLNQLKKYGVEI